MIILEEEYGDLVFVVKKGTIKITRVNDEGKEVILALLGPGEMFGELAILDGEARSANALAQENCELYAIRSEDFLQILKDNFEISLSSDLTPASFVYFKIISCKISSDIKISSSLSIYFN